jgi:hypothetical protein
MTTKTGYGPAFPCDIETGMSLRDYFAAKAMQGILADSSTPEIMDIAGAAYEIADAMLKARQA